MPPQLAALTEGPDILLDKPIMLVGRHQECDIQISSRKVSRKHCLIAQVNDHLVVRDLFSTNGIRINGVRVHEGRLKSGDELTIANFRYQVRLKPENFSEEKALLENAAAQSAPLSRRSSMDSSEEPVALSDSLGRDFQIGALEGPPPQKMPPEEPPEEPAADAHLETGTP